MPRFRRWMFCPGDLWTWMSMQPSIPDVRTLQNPRLPPGIARKGNRRPGWGFGMEGPGFDVHRLDFKCRTLVWPFKYGFRTLGARGLGMHSCDV